MLAALVGLAVTLLSLYVSWIDNRASPFLGSAQYLTLHQIERIQQAIADYQKRSNAVPKSLENLVASEVPGMLEYDIKDGWGRPLMYFSDGTNYTIISYGRDGKPGGKGLDSDVTNKDLHTADAQPTLAQFVFDSPTRGITQTCIFCGVIAAWLTYLTARKPNFNKYDIGALVVQLFLTTIGALIIATVIAALHVPSGH